MIRTKNLTPENYYKQSRDFQLIGRVYDFIFNYLKTNTDIIENNPYSDNFDVELVNLLANTLGFNQTHEYNTKQLMSLCSVFSHTLRNKGNIKSIEEILNVLANVEDSSEKFITNIDPDNPYNLLVYIPVSLKDTTLFEDVLDYVLPVGMSYTIISQLLFETNKIEDTSMKLQENEFVNYVSDSVIKAGLVKNVAHSAKTGQVLKTEEADLPTRSDVQVGRIDDMTVIRVDDNSGDVSSYVNSKKQTLYKHKVIFNSSYNSIRLTGNEVEQENNNVYIINLNELETTIQNEVISNLGELDLSECSVIVYCYEDSLKLIPGTVFKTPEGKEFDKWDVQTDEYGIFHMDPNVYEYEITALWK